MKRKFKDILLKIFIKDVEELKRKNKIVAEKYNAKIKEQNRYFTEKKRKMKEETAIKLAENTEKIEKRKEEIKSNNEILKNEMRKGIKYIKVGFRKPSINKSIKARTTSKVKRELKGMVNPLYGQKGMGWVNNPKRAFYNKTYRRTTKSIFK